MSKDFAAWLREQARAGRIGRHAARTALDLWLQFQEERTTATVGAPAPAAQRPPE